MSKKQDKIIEALTFMATLIEDIQNGQLMEMDVDRLNQLVKELKEKEEPKHSIFTGKEVILFYKANEETDIENPIVTILGEVEGFGLYVEFEDGNKEVVAFTELSGWGELSEEDV